MVGMACRELHVGEVLHTTKHAGGEVITSVGGMASSFFYHLGLYNEGLTFLMLVEYKYLIVFFFLIQYHLGLNYIPYKNFIHRQNYPSTNNGLKWTSPK